MARMARKKAKLSPEWRKKTPRSRKPEDMTLEEWQIALRREFAVVQDFQVENVGAEPVFSEFMVTNPATEGTYRVAIRGEKPGDNFCSCVDFSVNTLGTCKHVEFVLDRLRRKRGGAAALARGFQPPYSEIYLRYGLKREVVFKPGTLCPPELMRSASSYFDANGTLRPEAHAHFDAFLREAGQDGRNGHELRCYEDAIGYVARLRDDERRRERIDEAFGDGPDSAAFGRLLKAALYPYQRTGALFAARAGRCLIADDMGLGKTIQAIAAAEILAGAAGIERALVVCPTSLKHQWKDEIGKFSGRTAEVVEGLLAARTACYQRDTFFKITNYDVIHRDVDAIRAWAPDLIILDEAQRIKNWKTRRAKSVKRLPSEHAIVLTGTPLENRLEELHSIVEFVDRFHLGPAFRFLAEHQHVDEFGKVVGYRNLSAIATTLQPILLRRTKQEVLKELPERLDKNFLTPMTPEQMKHHEENRETVARIVAKWRRYGFLTDGDQRGLMIALQNMRMSCNSTYLLDKKTDYGVKADELATLLEEIFEQPETKAVIFSQWVRTHEVLLRRIEPRRWPYVLFHGGVPSKERGALVRRFKDDPQCRLFLSTDAGGVGLNLQSASVVVNMDQPWNPAVLEQRIGRVHRLGQHRPVRVINFVAQGTIEHGMLSLIAFKKSMFAGVLDGGSDEVFLGGTRLKQFMESVEKATDNIPSTMPRQDEAAVSASQEAAEEAPAEEREEAEAKAAEAAEAGPEQAAWTDAVSAGLSFLEKLGKAMMPEKAAEKGESKAPESPAAAILGSVIGQDERTGQPYLKLPMPKPETLQTIANLLNALAGRK